MLRAPETTTKTRSRHAVLRNGTLLKYPAGSVLRKSREVQLARVQVSYFRVSSLFHDSGPDVVLYWKVGEMLGAAL